MSRGLGPEPGGPPPKVVFAGVEEGSREEAELFNSYSGEIGRFHFKARQAAQLSGLPQFHMHNAIDGMSAMASYTRNNGQETLRVELENEIVVQAPRPKPEPQPQPPGSRPRWLAIDVLIDAAVYRSVDLEEYETRAGVRTYTGHLDFWAWSTAVLAVLELVREGEPPLRAFNGAYNFFDFPGTVGDGHPGDAMWCVQAAMLGEPVPGGMITAPVTPLAWIPDGVSEGIVGVGFIARISSRGKLNFNLYLGNQNIQLIGVADDSVPGDDTLYTPPPTTFDTTRFHINVRELKGDPVGVEAPVAYQGNYLAIDENGDPLPDNGPFPTPPIVVPWYFAAESDWQPDGDKVSDPAATGMGHLLESTDIRVIETPGSPVHFTAKGARSLYNVFTPVDVTPLVDTIDADERTALVATIEYTPPRDPNRVDQHGTVEITPTA